MFVGEIESVQVGTQLKVVKGGLHGVEEGTIVKVVEVDPEGLYGEYWKVAPAPKGGGWVRIDHVELV